MDGRFSITQTSSVRSDATTIGRAAFFIPLIWTFPRSGVPPLMISFSISIQSFIYMLSVSGICALGGTDGCLI
jgi:hypothetical protein